MSVKYLKILYSQANKSDVAFLYFLVLGGKPELRRLFSIIKKSKKNDECIYGTRPDVFIRMLCFNASVRWNHFSGTKDVPRSLTDDYPRICPMELWCLKEEI